MFPRKLLSSLRISRLLTKVPSQQSRSFSKGADQSGKWKERALSTSYPNNVGVIAMEAYFPSTYVNQEALETYDGVGKGKYTIGLEQEAMAFCDDREDIYSMALTATHSLLEKYKIDPKSIGRLEVGTETLIDKSKSIKSVLMTLFDKSGNANIEGVDTINACYGGTNALLNAVNWVESSSWDGRYALVVTGDIAVYAPGPARPTGGVGVVAMLIGENAPISLERGLRASHMEHAWDFYKPNLESEYPLVDGKGSIVCYLRSLDNCYNLFKQRFHAIHNKTFDLDSADYALFHSPFTKQVRKSVSRMLYDDFLANDSAAKFSSIKPELKQLFKSLSPEESYEHKDVQKVFQDLSKDLYSKKTDPSLLLPKQLGNSYTASLYTGLLSLIATKEDKDLVHKRLFMFSYGSGLAATMFSFGVRSSLADIRNKSDILNRLKQRKEVDPVEYTKIMKLREQTHSQANYRPTSTVDTLFPGTYYLERIDEMKRRYYARK